MSTSVLPPPDIIRLLLVDNHVMFLEGVARMLKEVPDFTVAALSTTVAGALTALPRANPTVVLLEADLGSARAVDFIRGARQAGFSGFFLILTAGLSDAEAVQLVQAGVSGILHKHHSTSDLCDTIRLVASGKVSLEPPYLAPLFRSLDRTKAAQRPTLTERDRAVVRDVSQGLTNRAIAARLQISEGAVKASLRHVCEKLGVRTRTQLVKVALEQYKDQLGS